MHWPQLYCARYKVSWQPQSPGDHAQHDLGLLLTRNSAGSSPVVDCGIVAHRQGSAPSSGACWRTCQAPTDPRSDGSLAGIPIDRADGPVIARARLFSKRATTMGAPGLRRGDGLGVCRRGDRHSRGRSGAARAASYASRSQGKRSTGVEELAGDLLLRDAARRRKRRSSPGPSRHPRRRPISKMVDSGSSR